MDITIHNGILDQTLKPVHIGIHEGKIAVVSESDIPPGERSIDAGWGDGLAPLHRLALPPGKRLPGSGAKSERHAERSDRHLRGHQAEARYHRTSCDVQMRVAREAIANGTLWMRSHVDIDHIGKLRLLESVLAARQAVKGLF